MKVSFHTKLDSYSSEKVERQFASLSLSSLQIQPTITTTTTTTPQKPIQNPQVLQVSWLTRKLSDGPRSKTWKRSTSRSWENTPWRSRTRRKTGTWNSRKCLWGGFSTWQETFTNSISKPISPALRRLRGNCVEEA